MMDMSNSEAYGVLFDHGRTARIGLPEAVLCEGKNQAALLALLTDCAEDSSQAQQRPILFTRLLPKLFHSLPPDLQARYNYHELSRTAFCATLPARPKGLVGIVSAGTADGSVTWEAARTLEYLGIHHQVYEDNGVAGLWRLSENLDKLARADALIVVAGLDAALASVVGGLTAKPVFGVPTSVGYGVARHGRPALASMLASCAPGIGVFNIDNGYGAACAAARVINLLNNQ